MRCFFFDALLGTSIASSDAIEVNCPEALHHLNALSHEPGSFFGVVRSTSPVVQFFWDEADQVSIDIPLPDKGGSMTKPSNLEECQQIVSRMFSGADPTKLAGLNFVSWK